MDRKVVPSAYLLLFAIMVPFFSAQQVLKVPSQYKTIQAAIDAAKGGDTVLVAPGLYQESVDFKGKAITVTSSHGPEATVINGGTVVFKNGEGNDSVLDGFTIQNASRGIYCTAAPIIRNNIVKGNHVRSYYVDGGGVYCDSPGSPAIILNNVVTNNSIIAPENFLYQYRLRGGGIYCNNAIVVGNEIASNSIRMIPYIVYQSVWVHGGGIYGQNSIIVNNIIRDNSADMIRSPGSGVAHIGAGIYSAGNSRIVNNTVVRNVAWASYPHVATGGGVAGSALVMANCIVRDNTAKTSPETSVAATIVFCNIKGGHMGIGNFDAGPRFTSDNTYHLKPDSPCRDVGSKDYLNFSASDFEWDERGSGSGVDVGADEFAPHVYHHGETRLGKTFTLTVIGSPGRVVWLGYAAGLLQKAIPIPGSGQLWLDPITLQLMMLGTVPANGRIELRLSVPASAPLGSVPFQALVGIHLTRPEVIQVAP